MWWFFVGYGGLVGSGMGRLEYMYVVCFDLCVIWLCCCVIIYFVCC